jgi:pilus assembly protein CpaB
VKPGRQQWTWANILYTGICADFGFGRVLLVYTRIIVPSQQRAAQLAQATPTPTPVDIVIVSQNVPKGFALDETVLSVIPWQEAAIAPGMFRGETLKDLYGRQVKYDLQAGTPLLDPMLLKEGEQIPTSGSAWALNIPTGMVAVSIPMDRLAGVSYAPRPGDHVNVIVSLLFVELDTDFQSTLPNLTSLVIAAGPPDPETKESLPLTVNIAGGIVGKTTIDPVLGQAVYNYPSGPQRPRLVSQTLLQDVVVLQIGNFPLPGEELKVATEATPTPAAEEQQGGLGGPPSARTSSLYDCSTAGCLWR